MPERDRQRQLLALAEDEVAASELGQEAAFAELWQKVEAMLTSYSDESFVSDDYARELTTARARAVDVERDQRRSARAHRGMAGDGERRVAARAGSPAARRPAARSRRIRVRWRDVAETVVAHADDLVRVGYFDQALAARRGGRRRRRARCPTRQPHATGGARAVRPRRDDEARRRSSCAAPTTTSYERFKRLSPRHRAGGDRAARRGALGRAGRAIAAAAARHPGRVRRRRAASRCSS